MSSLVLSESRARRNVFVLVVAQAFLGSQLPMIFIMGGLAGQSLAINRCWATLPISMIVLGSMLTAPVMSHIMQRWGRRTGFMLGTLAGAIGASISAYALIQSSFLLFLLGSLVTGIYMSANGFYRFAAVDTASDTFRPKAMSYVMGAGLLSAVFGSQMASFTTDYLAVPFLGTYLLVIAINVVGSLLFLALDIPIPPAPSHDVPSGRTRWEMIKTPGILVAVIAAMVSYALMNLVMTSTPLAIVGVGYTKSDAANVVMGHVLAMYGPSFFTGFLIVRFGVRKIVATGLVILAAAGLVGLAGVNLMNFYVGLILLGIGWNFGFIGASTMLTGAHSPEERGRIQGLNDMIVFGFVTLASVASGGLMNCSGSSVIHGWNSVNLAMIPLLALAGSALIWLVMRPKDA